MLEVDWVKSQDELNTVAALKTLTCSLMRSSHSDGIRALDFCEQAVDAARSITCYVTLDHCCDITVTRKSFSLKGLSLVFSRLLPGRVRLDSEVGFRSSAPLAGSVPIFWHHAKREISGYPASKTHGYNMCQPCIDPFLGCGFLHLPSRMQIKNPFLLSGALSRSRRDGSSWQASFKVSQKGTVIALRLHLYIHFATLWSLRWILLAKP